MLKFDLKKCDNNKLVIIDSILSKSYLYDIKSKNIMSNNDEFIDINRRNKITTLCDNFLKTPTKPVRYTKLSDLLKNNITSDTKLLVNCNVIGITHDKIYGIMYDYKKYIAMAYLTISDNIAEWKISNIPYDPNNTFDIQINIDNSGDKLGFSRFDCDDENTSDIFIISSCNIIDEKHNDNAYTLSGYNKDEDVYTSIGTVRSLNEAIDIANILKITNTDKSFDNTDFDWFEIEHGDVIMVI